MAEKRRKASLAWLLTAWYTTACFLLIAAATGLLYLGLANNLRKISEQSLRDELDVCRALVLARGGDSHALHEEVEIDSAVRRYQKYYVRVLDRNGSPLSTTPGMDRELPRDLIARTAADQYGIFWVESPNGAAYRAVVAKIPRDATGQDIWTLQVAVDLTQEREVLGNERVWEWSVLGIAMLLCPGVGFFIALRGTRPLREVAETARRIGSTTLNERIVDKSYPSEVHALADAFNAMLERLEESFGRLSRFSADIAHELRTPVSNIRGGAEVALARARTPDEYVEILGSCLEEAVRLTELIESLLFLARSESPGDHLECAPTDIGELLTDLCDYYEAKALEAGVKISVQADGEILANVDRQLLSRALGNLISNSMAHCSAGDGIQLNAGRDRRGAVIGIHDTGSGISAEALPHVFDRFYREDPARARNRGGVGLGLAIVRQIVHLHKGDVQVSSGQTGTTVSVILPDIE